MSPLIKVAVAAGGGAFLSQYIEPHLVGLIKPESDMAKKAVNAAAAGIAGAGIYYVIKGT